METFNEEQDHLMRQGKCPKCLCTQFRYGPQGGCAQNIRCAGCGTEYWWGPPFPAMFLDRDDPSLYSKATFSMPAELKDAGMLELPAELKDAGMLELPKRKSWWRRPLGL